MRTLFLSLVAGIALASASNADEPKSTRRNVAIVVHEGVELLDFAGPGEVFSSADGGRAFRVFTVNETDQPIKSQRFLTVTPEFTIANCPKPDIIVIPGGATGVLRRSPTFMNWIKERAPETEIMFSVCTGAFVLSDAGLLDGLEATTHYASIERLKQNSKIKVRDDRRVVDNGRIVTSAGVSAGIDGALHLVSRLHGKDIAERTAKYMEYRWQPEATKSTQADSLYDRARALAKAEQKAEALTHFEKAIAANASDIERALAEADFECLRSEPRFRKVFQAHAQSRARLTPAGEPGDALVVSGTVHNADNKPVPDAIVYVYHTNHRGHYSANTATRDDTPRLFGYLKTDAQGRYEFRTIRPGGYPDSKVPQHIHYEVTIANNSRIVTEFFFPDDPRLGQKDREQAQRDKMLATLSRDADGTQRAVFDVVVSK